MTYEINLLQTVNGTLQTPTDVTQYVVNGFSVVQKLDESLDIGTITLRGLTSGVPYGMFDVIQIKIDGTEFTTLRIGGDNVRLISKNPLRYEHVLSLVEHTKLLELYQISGKTFTQPIDGTIRYYIDDVIGDLRATTPIELTNLFNTTRIFDLPTSGDLYDLITTTPSPEFTFKDCTLREALDEVASFLNGISRLTYDSSDGSLEYTIDFVNDLQNLISTFDSFNEYNTTQEISLYATQLESEALNMVSDTDLEESVEVYPNEKDWVTPRSDEYIFDFTKSYIPTPKPISEIYQVKMFGGLILQNASTSAEYYNSERMYYYANGTGNFPTVGRTLVRYIDTSDSNQMYEWNGSAYSPITEAVDIPNISYYSSTSAFPTTGSVNVIYIAVDTELTYRWDTSYIQISGINFDGTLDIDLTDRVLEFNKYKYQDADDNDNTDPTKFYQSNTLYYNYRQQNIQSGMTTGIFNTASNLSTIMALKAFEILNGNGFLASSLGYDDVNISTVYSENNALLRVSYIPIPKSQRINIDREDLTDVDKYSTLLSNQQSRIVNLQNYSNSIYQRVNKIGNTELDLKTREISVSNLNTIGDYTSDGYIVTQAEYIFFKDFIQCGYGLSRNYNMLNKFIGVNSEVRQFEMGEQNTLDRNIIYKEYIEVDALASGNGSDSSYWFQSNGIQTFLNTFDTTSTDEPVRGGIIDVTGLLGEKLIGISSNGGGSSLIFSFKMNDNVSVGDFRETLNSQTARNFSPYTDEDGIMTSATFTLFDTVDTILEQNNKVDIADLFPETDVTRVVNTKIENDFPLLIYKDSREILGGSFIFPVLPKVFNKVGIGKAFLTRNRLVTEEPPSSIKLYVYTNGYTFGRLDTKKRPTGFSNSATLTGITLNVDTTNKKLEITSSILTSLVDSYCLTDENDNILLWVNQDGTKLDTITFDFLNKRSGVNYKY